MLRFFRSLRGKLIITYTLVTVLALLALEVLLLLGAVATFSLFNVDRRDYLADVFTVLYPQAREYLQPGAEDRPGLQAWLETVSQGGRASIEPTGFMDSPAALLVPGEPLTALSPEGVVLAQVPAGDAAPAGGRYTPPAVAGAETILERARSGVTEPLRLYTLTPHGDYLLAVPVLRAGLDSEVVGVLMLTVEPEPPLLFTLWPVLLGSVVVTAALLLLAVAPFGALFGFIMSRGLTRRLGALAQAADAWSDGNFVDAPRDRAQDEIGHLGRRLRHMAERVQLLLQTQQALAALQERNRLARDLHDTVKQQSFATLMQVRAARNLLAQSAEGPGADRHLAEAESLLKTSQQELGRLIAELRPAALDGQGLAGALRAYVDTWREHSRIAAELQVQNERGLPLEMEQALYRVAQEALANVVRHSRASAVTLRLSYEARSVVLTIIDNGAGFDPLAATAGFGLQSMRQRVEACGGRLDVTSSAAGTALVAAVPAAPPAALPVEGRP